MSSSFSFGSVSVASPAPQAATSSSTPSPAATTAQATVATTPTAPAASSSTSNATATDFGSSAFGASPTCSGFAAFAGSSTSFSGGGSGGLFGSPISAATPSAFGGCSPSSGFSFASRASSAENPFGLPSGFQAQAATGTAAAVASPNTPGFHAVYPPSTSLFAPPPGVHPHQPVTYQVPPTSSTFGTPAVLSAPAPAPQLKQQPNIKTEVAKKRKPVSSLEVDEDKGSVRFPSRDGAEFRYRLTLTKSDKIKVWIQDQACKHQWQSRELGLSEIVPTEKAIPMMELKDYFESFKCCLMATNVGPTKGSSKYDLVTPLKREKSDGSDGNDIELQLTLSVVIFSKVLTPTYSFLLHSVAVSEMDVLNAKIHDQDDEIEQLRTQVDALASKMASTMLCFSAPAAPATSLFGNHIPTSLYIRAETTRITNPDQSLVWKKTDEAAGLFGGIYQLHDSGAIRFSRDGLYSVQVVVHHTNTNGSENGTSFFGRGYADRAAFFLQRNGLAVASSFGSNATGSIQSSPLHHLLSVRSGEELRVVYYGTGIAKEGSYIIIHEIK